MRILLILGLAVLAAACARTPQPVATTPTPSQATRPTGELVGLSVSDLSARFGQPSFQVREGAGLKLQWASSACVLDAYLYPSAAGRGGERVTHVDARRPSGDDLDARSCAALLAR